MKFLLALLIPILFIIFIVFWWKKRKARLAAGDAYKNDEKYKNVSTKKTIIGTLCLLSFIGFIAIPIPPEDLAQIEATRQANKEKEARLAEEKKAAEELQKKYDDQAKYEEWVAWQKSETEKKEKEELQKKYDDQAKYEEWIAWQKSEDDKRLAAEAKEKERQEAERNKYSPVNVWDIYNAYKGNAARANKAYAGKYVKIMGSVVVNIESGGHVISTGVIEGNEYFSLPHAFIHCYPKTEDAKSAIYNMNNNQTIIIYGKVKDVGEVMGYYVDVDKFEW